ncbi:hypothetical protein MUK42_19976 [Musa troglodytarum]|uniref:Uncharacterized protein n=1 Tax=Musa troglodytarum TaxID=320322 RepID=A0A9E7EMR8_9LILI|nr:hypothetical protein MUK42_19976 [Musa troglodytarum]
MSLDIRSYTFTWETVTERDRAREVRVTEISERGGEGRDVYVGRAVSMASPPSMQCTEGGEEAGTVHCSATTSPTVDQSLVVSLPPSLPRDINLSAIESPVFSGSN